MRILLLLLVLALTVGTGITGNHTAAAAESSEATEFNDPFAEPETKQIRDPLETLNRVAFQVNDFIYTRIFAPICRAASPKLGNTLAGVHAVFDRPIRLGGVELKFAFRDGGSEVGRFIMHSLLDLANQVEPAITQGLRNGEEDFGKTLQALGADSGIYLVLPVLGPSSLRDGIGRVASFYLDPSSRLCTPGGSRSETAGEMSLLGELQAYEEIRRQTLDPYLFLRDVYAQKLAIAERKNEQSPAFTSASPSDRPKVAGRSSAVLL
jgi:phospholipid-binding lipoprotein MlaA